MIMAKLTEVVDRELPLGDNHATITPLLQPWLNIKLSIPTPSKNYSE
jgi:hypothetical protein